jgi:GMP synthase-like glutamine amidotransferase
LHKPRALAIQNCAIEEFGLYKKYLEDNGTNSTVIHPYRDDILPKVEDYALILIGGTPLSAGSAEEHEFLRREMEFLSKAIDGGKFCLGICFGAQLLARILGASVSKCRDMEIGTYRVQLTTGGIDDPLLDGFPETFPVFQWHGDTFEIPEGGILLAEGSPCVNQMFRIGNIIGVQFHLETTCAEASLWAEEYSAEMKNSGRKIDQLVSKCREFEEERGKLARMLISNMLKEF